MAHKTNDLGRDPVGKLMARLALPAIVAQLVNALYNIVASLDGYYTVRPRALRRNYRYGNL